MRIQVSDMPIIEIPVLSKFWNGTRPNCTQEKKFGLGKAACSIDIQVFELQMSSHKHTFSLKIPYFDKAYRQR